MELDDIYQALADDDCFADLPARLAKELGARSGMMHWVHKDGGTEILSHSRYHSDDALVTYAQNFAMLDPWMIASQDNAVVDRAIDFERLVTVENYVGTRFFDEFIRPLGDDTARGIGLRVRTKWGSGFISFHRGAAQPPFESESVTKLDSYSVHLRRVLCVRGRFSSLQRRARGLTELVDALGDALFLVDGDGRVLAANEAAQDLIGTLSVMNLKNGLLTVSPSQQDVLLKAAIAKATREEPDAGAVTLFDPQSGRLNLSVVAAPAAGRRAALVVLSPPDNADPTVEDRLRALYQLSMGEAQIAIQLAAGRTPADIADDRQATIGTVRLQIKSLAAKLGCGRQADIVRLVAGLPRFASRARNPP